MYNVILKQGNFSKHKYGCLKTVDNLIKKKYDCHFSEYLQVLEYFYKYLDDHNQTCNKVVKHTAETTYIAE